MTGPEDLRGDALATYETWRSLGLTESMALAEVVDAGHVKVDGFDQLAASFRSLGMSDSAARTAAIGRDYSEAEARRGFAQVDKPAQTVSARSTFEERLTRLEGRQRRLDEAFRRKARGV